MLHNVERADERILLHVCNSSANKNRILIKTVDSGVVIIALLVFHKISDLIKLWIEFGTGKHLKFIPIHQLATCLSPAILQPLYFFIASVFVIQLLQFQRMVEKRFLKHGNQWKK